MKVLYIILILGFSMHFAKADPTLPNKVRVVIDLGYSESNTDNSSNALLEQQLVADVSSQLKAFCKAKNIEIIILQPNSELMSIQDKIKKIETFSPDLVISLNATYSTDRDRNGVEVFVAKNNYTDKSSYFGNKILESFKVKDFKTTALQSANFYLLKNLNCPAVSVELGFLFHEEDMKYLNSDFGQKFLAKQIATSLD